MQLVALLATLVIEGAGMALFAVILPGWRPHFRRAALLALGLNLISHTVFWHALPHLPLPPAQALPLAEWIVIAVEGAIYAAAVARPAWTGWLVSIVLNYASWVFSTYLWR